MTVRKAVIPAAGLGTRFLPATKAQPKEMLPVVDKPTIQYVVEEAVAAGLDDVLVITGRGKDVIADHFDRALELEHHLADRDKSAELATVRQVADLAEVHFVRQGSPLGLGHAVYVARRHVGDEPFAVLLGDDLYVDDAAVLRGLLEAHATQGTSVVAVKECVGEEISLYGAVQPRSTTPEGLVQMAGVVEKPAPSEAPSNLGLMGRYVFTPAIFDALAETPPGKGGEVQLTDAIGRLLATEPVHALPFREGRYDTGNKVEYLRANLELALRRPDLAPAVRELIAEVAAREGIVG